MSDFPQTKEALTALLHQQIVFDVGQISKPLKRWLDREVKAGRVQRVWNTQRFPQGRFMYWIVPMKIGDFVKITGGVSAHGKVGQISDLEIPGWVGVRIPNSTRATETTFITLGSASLVADKLRSELETR